MMKLLDIDSNGDVILKNGDGNYVQLTKNGEIASKENFISVTYTRDALTTNYNPPTSSSVYSDSGLSVTIDVEFGQIIELEADGQIQKTTSIADMAFLMRFELSDGTVLGDYAYYHKDGNLETYTRPFNYKTVLIGGEDIPTGSQTIKLTVRNITASSNVFDGNTAETACYLASKQFSVQEISVPEGITFHQDELTSNFNLLNVDTTYTDTGLSITITALENQWVEIYTRGTIFNGSSDDFDIEVALVVDGTVVREWQNIDVNNSLHRKTFEIYHSMRLKTGSKEIKVQAKNNQGTTVNFQGGTNQRATLDVAQHGV